MAYQAYDVAKPTTAQTRQAAIDSERTNLAAMRDALIATGIVQGFDYSALGGTPEQPAQIFYKRGVEWIRVDLTWGTVSGEAGNVTKLVFYYSANSGGAYDPMADLAGKYVASLTYDANGNTIAMTWGSNTMIGVLMGVPGKLKTLIDRMTAGRAANLDNLDVPVSSRAPAASALNTAVWTNTRAGYLDALATPVPSSFIKSIQPISITLVGTALTGTATISAVVTAKTVVIPNGFTTNFTITKPEDYLASYFVTNTTTITVNRQAAAVGGNFRAFVVEFT